MDTIDLLRSMELYLLAAAVNAEHEETAKLILSIQTELGIDISDIEALSHLTDEQKNILKSYETSNSNQITGIILLAQKIVPVVAPVAPTPLPDKTTFSQWFGALITMTTVVYVFMITFLPIPEGNERFVDVCLGFLLGTIVSTIINFFYGNSVPKVATTSYSANTTKSY